MNKTPRSRRWLILPTVISALLCVYLASHAASDQPSHPFHLSILHTNDLHSHDEPFLERGRELGGITRIGHMIHVLKKQEPEAVVIDAGDMFQGSPMYTKYHGAVEVALLNMIGYDIFTIGNHEFDDGPENLAEQLKKAKFQIINCNMDCSAVPQLAALIKPYVVREIDGQKVAFIGVITPELNQVALRTGGVKIIDPGKDWMKPIIEQINAVKAKGINKIILVTHVGIEKDKELGELADVDAIISGHSHTRLDEPVVIAHPDGSSTTIVQTGCFSRALGKLELTFDDQGRVIVPKTEYRLINMTAKVQEEPDMRALVDEKVKPLLPLRHTFVGVAKEAFDNGFRNMPCDSPLGDVICDALVESGKKYGAQISFENRGGIRGRIEPGPISLEEVEQILPFDNRGVYATINGACLMQALEHSVAGGLGGPFFDEHGLQIAYDPQAPKGHRIVFALAQAPSGEWKPLSPTDKYKIAINDYSFGGGEGYDFKSATDIVRGEQRLSEIFKQYMRNHHEITPQPPTRLVPVTSDMLTIEGNDIAKLLKVSKTHPFARVTFVDGSGYGVSTISGDIAVPLADAKIIGRARCDQSGTCELSLPATTLSRKYAAAVVLPPKGSAGKKQFSYPIAVH